MTLEDKSTLIMFIGVLATLYNSVQLYEHLHILIPASGNFGRCTHILAFRHSYILVVRGSIAICWWQIMYMHGYWFMPSSKWWNIRPLIFDASGECQIRHLFASENLDFKYATAMSSTHCMCSHNVPSDSKVHYCRIALIFDEDTQFTCLCCSTTGRQHSLSPSLPLSLSLRQTHTYSRWTTHRAIFQLLFLDGVGQPHAAHLIPVQCSDSDSFSIWNPWVSWINRFRCIYYDAEISMSLQAFPDYQQSELNFCYGGGVFAWMHRRLNGTRCVSIRWRYVNSW